MRTLLVSLLFLSCVFVAQGLYCWTCDNAQSNEECITKGRKEKCNQNQQMCETEIRKRGDTMRVKKMCKQTHACANNEYQNNKAAASPTQCNDPFPGDVSVCRCCTNNFNISMDSLYCEKAPPKQDDDCAPVTLNPGVKMNCANKETDVSKDANMPFGTVCTFGCGEGFSIVGSPRTLCGREKSQVPTFDYNSPTCQPSSCNSLKTLANGETKCSKGFASGSVCTFTCDSGYELRGNLNTECMEDMKKWNNPIPTCNPLCDPTQTGPSNGRVSCSNANSLNSLCRFTCNPGFVRTGRESTTCRRNGNRASWSNQSAQPTNCTLDCPPAIAPPNGKVSCSNSDKLGSICTYTCNSGFVIENGNLPSPSNTIQTCTGIAASTTGRKARWNPQRTTICKPINCTALTAPLNGDLLCDNNRLGGKCTLNCVSGYYPVGIGSNSPNTEATCVTTPTSNQDGTGVWNPRPLATCEPITCSPLNPLINGEITCDDGNKLGSKCTYTCNSGFPLVGSGSNPPNAKTTCVAASTSNQDGKGVWDPTPPPTCPIRCSAPPPLINGEVTCPSGNEQELGNKCTYTCQSGSTLGGTRFGPTNNQITCIRNNSDTDGIGRWSPIPPPICQSISCSEPFIPDHGNVTCTNGRFGGSECKYACEYGYNLIGSDGNRLVNNKMVCSSNQASSKPGRGTWQPTLLPSCEAILCESLKTVARGHAVCHEGYRVGQSCTFSCEDGYTLVGFNKSSCIFKPTPTNEQNVVWTHLSPQCQKPCDVKYTTQDFDPSLKASVKCTNGYFTQSVCTFTCQPGLFNFDGLSVTRKQCIDSKQATGEGSWFPPGSPKCEEFL